MDDTLKLYIQPADSIFFLKEFGITNTEIIKDKITVEDITIHRTGGTHGKETIMEMMGEVSGFMLQAENQPTVYIVGDCLAMVNGIHVNGYEPAFGWRFFNHAHHVFFIHNQSSEC